MEERDLQPPEPIADEKEGISHRAYDEPEPLVSSMPQDAGQYQPRIGFAKRMAEKATIGTIAMSCADPTAPNTSNTLAFDANGGTGRMSDQNIVEDGAAATKVYRVEAPPPPILGFDVFKPSSGPLVIYVPAASLADYQVAWGTYLSYLAGY